MSVSAYTVSEMSDNTTELIIAARSSNEEYISKETAQLIQTIITLGFIPAFCLFGSIGNILSLIVLFHQRMRNQTNYILGALCISDTLLLLHSGIFTGIAIQTKLDVREGMNVRAHIFPFIGAYTSIVMARITSGLTTLLCVERFIAVYFPMQAHMTCTKRNTVIAILLIFVTTFLVFLPFALKWTPATQVTPMNTTITRSNLTDFYFNNIPFFTIYGTLLNVIYRFVPLLIIPILNVLMIRAVHRTWKLRRKMSATTNNMSRRFSGRTASYANTDEENHITIMLLTVSFVFFILILPGALNSIATHVWKDYSRKGRQRQLYKTLFSITYLFETINSSVNFIIYMACSKTFRSLYKKKFCCTKTENYINVSLSSLKEKFRITKRRTSTELFGNSDFYSRRTVSDAGPLRKISSSSKRLEELLEIHSEGYEINGNRLLRHDQCERVHFV